MSKIIKLTAENIKRVVAIEVELDKDNNLVVINGKNGQGKSSLMDSIIYALGGQGAIDPQPINKDKDEGKVEITLDTGEKVVRTFKKEGEGFSTDLKVFGADGLEIKKPQSYLFELVQNTMTFDPLEFQQKKPKEQKEMLIEILGIDITELEKKIERVFNERTLIGREGEQLKGQFEALVAPTKEALEGTIISISELSNQLTTLQAQKSDVEVLKQKDVKEKEEVANLSSELERITQKLKESRENNVKTVDLIKEKQGKISEEDIARLQAQINNAETKNNEVRKAQEYRKVSDTLEEKRIAYKNMGVDIDVLRKEKVKVLADALKNKGIALEGITIEDDILLVNDIPFEQLSTSEQINISMRLVIASDSKLKIALIHRGESLDNNSLKQIFEIAKISGMQLWIESVGDQREVGTNITIEDGLIK